MQNRGGGPGTQGQRKIRNEAMSGKPPVLWQSTDHFGLCSCRFSIVLLTITPLQRITTHTKIIPSDRKTLENRGKTVCAGPDPEPDPPPEGVFRSPLLRVGDLIGKPPARPGVLWPAPQNLVQS